MADLEPPEVVVLEDLRHNGPFARDECPLSPLALAKEQHRMQSEIRAEIASSV